jgi:GNAT superfamily N-acetyltransferase
MRATMSSVIGGDDSIRIYRAEDADLSDLATLRYRWRTSESGEEGLSLEDYDEQHRDWLVRHRSSHTPYLVAHKGHPVGCGWLVVIDRVPGPGRFIRQGGMIQSVYIVPEFRNQGLGARLMKVIIEDARVAGLDYLMVHPSSKAFDFYRRLGFNAAEKLLELRFVP